MTPPGQNVRPGGQAAVLSASDPSQQATGVGGAGCGVGHSSPAGTLTAPPAHWVLGIGHSSMLPRIDPSAQMTVRFPPPPLGTQVTDPADTEAGDPDLAVAACRS